MGSLLGILNTGRLGIIANQTALSVTGNNIANVNTEGYSRQRPDMQSLASNGVRVAHIERLRDEYLNTRLQEATTSQGGSSLLAVNLKSIEALMDETEDSGISKSIRDFFSTMQDLTLQPSGSTERDTLRSSAKQLAAQLKGLASSLQQVQSQLDQQVGAAVNRVNAITSEIAQINQKLAETSPTGVSAQQGDTNLMFDRRDQLINELSGYMPVNVLKSDRGLATIFAGGEVLVEGTSQRTLAAVPDPANLGHSALAIREPGGSIHPLTKPLAEGSLGAMLQVRDQEAGVALTQVEQLTATLIRAVNVQHRAGTGLDGVSGRDFFQGLSANATSSWLNTGGAAVTAATITDDTQLTFDDYEIRFTAPGQYDVVNATTGAAVSSGNAYSSGGAITFAGMSITVTDSGSGPAAGDVFRVNAYAGAASRMALAPAVAANAQAIAAGQGGAAGDNRNAGAMAGLIDKTLLGNPPSMTFEAFYQMARVKIATATQNAQSAASDSAITQQQIQAMADGISGVSLDEEATKIIQYQRAFESSSRVISTTNELMQTLINMI